MNMVRTLILGIVYLFYVIQGDEQIKKASLDGHNKHRKNAGLEIFTWDDNLGKFEQFLIHKI